jgi:hypothetical protein
VGRPLAACSEPIHFGRFTVTDSQSPIHFTNRSEIVGRPLAAMLANDGADVYSVDLNGVYLMRRGKMFEVCGAANRFTITDSLSIHYHRFAAACTSCAAARCSRRGARARE